MRKYQVKSTLESYAAVLSCIGNMDLFDPNIARRIILDLEQQVKLLFELFYFHFWFFFKGFSSFGYI